MLAAVPAARGVELQSGSDQAVEPHTANVDSDALPKRAVKSCVTIGFPEGSVENAACSRDLILVAASPTATIPVSSGRAMQVAKHMNLGELCAPYYPRESRAAREQGSTEFIFWVDADGRVREGLVAVSSGISRLDIAAGRCIFNEGRFVPRSIDGKPVGSWQRMKWTWRLAP